ncbi:methyltransferase [Mesorhizobium sp. VK25A]|uniref:Methyltransferase n=1 Tax=Mesorhizobium vachelliae TaxID=3072309 RepID=A0ABU5A4Q7_9HYPH|nr:MULTISPECIES: methyltransferase [unclassified Mesorhizobium]MDX8532210.1 methyltransferase [Mesorhizobium sp. VK25D]MDX8545486.1 methyltransferase [Mesorhizobium sp. VK25A]
MRNNLQRASQRTTTLARERPNRIPLAPNLTVSAQPRATEPDLPSAVPLMGLATGFWAFKALAAAHALDLFSRLAGGKGTTAGELAQTLGLHQRPAEMLLTGCAALGLLEKSHGRYRNTPLSEAYLVRGKPYYFGGFVQMADKRLYPGWDKLEEALRSNRPTTWDPAVQSSAFDGEDPTMLALFWEAMHSLSTMTARKLGEAVDLSQFRHLLDIGGGSAAYDIELSKQYAELRATVLELPHVAAIAAGKIAEAGLADRIETVGGSFFEQLPENHDVHLFSMILHDWDEAKNRALLRRSFEALQSGGAVVISELLVNDEKTGPAPAALMSLNMLIETEGRNYTPAEYSAWLEEAGFRDIETIWFDAPAANGAVIGRKP